MMFTIWLNLSLHVFGFGLSYYPALIGGDWKMSEKYAKSSYKWDTRLRNSNEFMSTVRKVNIFLQSVMGEFAVLGSPGWVTDAPEAPSLVIGYSIPIERGGGKIAGLIITVPKNNLNNYTFYFFDNFKELDEFVMSVIDMNKICKKYSAPWWKLPDVMSKKYGDEITYCNTLRTRNIV